LRETKFYKWNPGASNYASLLIMVVAVPALLYTFNRADLVSAWLPTGSLLRRGASFQVVKAEKVRGSKTAQSDYA